MKVRKKAMGWKMSWDQEGSMSAKGDVRLKFVTHTVPANPNNVPYFPISLCKEGL